VTLEVKCH